MAEKLTITGVWRNDRTSAQGKPYTSVSIKTREYGDKYLSGFGAAWNTDWQVGTEVELEVTKKPGKDKEGKIVEYLNFTKPNPMEDFAKSLMSLMTRVSKLEEQMRELGKPKITVEATPATLPEPPDVDTNLPF